MRNRNDYIKCVMRNSQCGIMVKSSGDYNLGIRCVGLCEPPSAHKGAGDRLWERVGGGGVSNYADALSGINVKEQRIKNKE